MRISLRLILIASVAACAPMLPEVLPVIPTVDAPARAAVAPTTTPPGATPATPVPVVVDQAGFDGWKQGFLTRHGGARRADYERELDGLTPDPSVIRLDRNQPEFSRPAGTSAYNNAWVLGVRATVDF
jgi:membrane-bound lytic murein transglycosylase B